jgi:hypothetical protein
VTVVLVYEEDLGFSAEITVAGRTFIWIEANLAEAVQRYLYNEYGLQVFREDLAFRLDDEIVVDVKN